MPYRGNETGKGSGQRCWEVGSVDIHQPVVRVSSPVRLHSGSVEQSIEVLCANHGIESF